jgi:hypothetical protein
LKNIRQSFIEIKLKREVTTLHSKVVLLEKKQLEMVVVVLEVEKLALPSSLGVVFYIRVELLTTKLVTELE